jgi:cold shock CspA family protein
MTTENFEVLGQTFRALVSMWNSDRGFGYLIQPGKFKSKTFFHVSNWTSDTEPKVGQLVQYVLGAGKNPGQVQATDIILIRDNPETTVTASATAVSTLAEKADTQEAK